MHLSAKNYLTEKALCIDTYFDAESTNYYFTSQVFFEILFHVKYVCFFINIYHICNHLSSLSPYIPKSTVYKTFYRRFFVI